MSSTIAKLRWGLNHFVALAFTFVRFQAIRSTSHSTIFYIHQATRAHIRTLRFRQIIRSTLWLFSIFVCWSIQPRPKWNIDCSFAQFRSIVTPVLITARLCTLLSGLLRTFAHFVFCRSCCFWATTTTIQTRPSSQINFLRHCKFDRNHSDHQRL